MKKEMPEVVKHLLESISKMGGIPESDPETKVYYIPKEYYNDFFEEIVKVRGFELAGEFVEREGTLAEAFPWALSAKGHAFWQNVEKETKENYRRLNGVVHTQNSTNTVTSSTSESIDDVIKEAEARGFGEGVSTKYGIINARRTPSSPILEHELRPNGTFYYRNIKVRNSKGKWIKPNVDVKKEYQDASDASDAIHSDISEFIERLCN